MNDGGGDDDGRGGRRGAVLLVVLLVAHVVFAAARLPDKVIVRRVRDVERYEREGAAHFLLDSARLGGADVVEWVRQNVPEQQVVLWRRPKGGALEFVAALIAPRLLVDDARVPPGATTWNERLIARGRIPSGAHGAIVVAGTDDEGLRLEVRD